MLAKEAHKCAYISQYMGEKNSSKLQNPILLPDLNQTKYPVLVSFIFLDPKMEFIFAAMAFFPLVLTYPIGAYIVVYVVTLRST